MTDSTLASIAISAAAVASGIAFLYWKESRECARLEKLAKIDKMKMKSVYAQIHLQKTWGRGAGADEKRADETGDSAASHIIEVKPRVPRHLAPTVRLCDARKEKP